ncbi:unnamed protein product [marine sediment metagenome]|uniref:Uncharacterized protein n=1 Tax=marine sediment metagenome TaxID=412755 RepID=X1JWN2_9ZZZZ
MGMGGIRFELKPVAEKPERTKPGRTRKGRKYEPIIEGFLSGGHDLVRVEAENMDANYLRGQLAKIIKSRGLEGLVEASVVNGELYLERIGRSNDIS